MHFHFGLIAFTFAVMIGVSSFGQTTQPTTLPTSEPAAFVKKLQAGTPQKVVYYGTSLTEHGAWPTQVSDALTAAFPNLVTVKNSGGGGRNSEWGLQNVQQRIVAEEPDVVFIEFSINDAVERFNMPVEKSRENHEAIFAAILKARPDCQIILQTMSPSVGRPPGHKSHRKDLPAYETMYRDLAKQHGFLLIDHAPNWQTVLDKGEPEFRKYVPDGVHPNANGYAIYVTPVILRAIGVAEVGK